MKLLFHPELPLIPPPRPSILSPFSISIQQDSTTRSRRDNLSGSGLSSSALQRSHRDSFSGPPPGQLYKKVPLTDPYREARIAGGPRPGPAQTHPRAALPDVHLEIGAACLKLLLLAVLNVHWWCWTFRDWNGWSLLAVQNRPADEDPGLPGATTNGPRTAVPLRRTSQGSDLPPPVAGVNDYTTLPKTRKS